MRAGHLAYNDLPPYGRDLNFYWLTRSVIERLVLLTMIIDECSGVVVRDCRSVVWKHGMITLDRAAYLNGRFISLSKRLCLLSNHNDRRMCGVARDCRRSVVWERTVVYYGMTVLDLDRAGAACLDGCSIKH